MIWKLKNKYRPRGRFGDYKMGFVSKSNNSGKNRVRLPFPKGTHTVFVWKLFEGRLVKDRVVTGKWWI